MRGEVAGVEGGEGVVGCGHLAADCGAVGRWVVVYSAWVVGVRGGSGGGGGCTRE